MSYSASRIFSSVNRNNSDNNNNISNYANRFPAPGAPYATTNRHGTRRGQIASNGPMEKCTPQSIIAATIENGEPVVGRRNGEVGVDVLAPFSENKDIEHIARSDLLFTTVNGTGISKRTVDNMPSVRCFHAVNGVPSDEPVKFVGVGTFNGIGEGKDNTKDNVGACNLHGTNTIINTGDKTIKALDLVWGSEHPYMTKSEDGRGWVPGVLELGHDKSQFRPATYSLSYANTIGLINMIEENVRTLYRAEKLTDWSEVEKNINDMLNELNIRNIMPLYVYAYLYAAFLHMIDPKSLPANGGGEIITRALEQYWDFKVLNKEKYDVALDVGMEHTDEVIHKTTHSKFPDYKTNFDNFLVVGHSELHEGMKEMQALQHDFINARVIGLALNTAEPGKPLDVAVRSYHN